MATQGSIVTASDYNGIQQRIANLLGTGAGQFGYGQTVSSFAVVANETVIDQTHFSRLKTDITRIANHQGGTSVPLINTLPTLETGQTITATHFNSFENVLSTLENNKFDVAVGQYTEESFVPTISQERTTAWGRDEAATLLHTFTVDFGSADNARYFFNSGGNIKLTPSLESNSTPQNDSWKTLFTSMGTVTFDHTTCTSNGASPGVSADKGFYDLTTTPIQVFTKSSSSVYAQNDYTIMARCDVANNTTGSARTIIFQVYFKDDYIDTENMNDVVTGTLKHLVFVRRATGPNVEVTMPTAVTTVSLGSIAPVIDLFPEIFSFTDVTNAALLTSYTSNTVTVSGLEPNYSITVTASGGTVDAGTTSLSGIFAGSKTVTTSSTGTLVVAARAMSSSSFSTPVNCIVTVGGRSDTFTITTASADATPDTFTFTDEINAELSTAYTSNIVTVSGLEPNHQITITASNGTVDAGTTSLSGIFAGSKTVTTSSTGTLVVAARAISSSLLNSPVNCEVTVGNKSDTYTITTRSADLMPNSFSFTDINNANLSTPYTSDMVTVSGLEPNYSITVTASGGTVDAGTTSLSGTFASTKTVTTSSTGTLVISARTTSSSSFSNLVNCIVTVGNGSGNFRVTTRADLAAPFSFIDITGAEPATVYTSNIVTVSDLEPNLIITVTASGGLVDAGTSSLSGTFASTKTVTTSSTGTIVITARITSSTAFNSSANCTVTVSNRSDTFTVTTRAQISGPNPFTFADETNAALLTSYTSDTITVTGLESNFSTTITASGGTVDAGASSLSGTFASSKTVTTSSSGTLVIAAKVMSSSSYSTPANCTVTINGVSDTFTVTTRERPPVSEFRFDDVNSAVRSTVYNSNTVTVSGLEPNSSITVEASGGTVDAGTTSLSGSFAALKTVTASGSGTIIVRARVTSSSEFNSPVNCTVTVGSASDTYTVTTGSADITPDPFSFSEVNDATPSTVYTSLPVTITGLEPNYSIAISASNGLVDAGTVGLSGTYSTSKTVTTSSTGRLVVSARATSSSTLGRSVNCTITIGTGSGTYRVTTLSGNIGPDPFTFIDVTGASPSTSYTSNTITVTGLLPNYSTTVTASSGSVDAGTSSLSGSFSSSKTVTTSGSGTLVMQAKVTSSTSFGTPVNCTVRINNVSDTYTVTTRSIDLVPNPFSFIEKTNADPSTVYESNTITVSGLEPNYSITVTASGGTVDAGTSSLSGTFASSKTVTTSSSGTLQVAARATSNSTSGSSTTCTVTIGGVSGPFKITTISVTPPSPFTFTDITGADPSTVRTSNTITVRGMTPNYSVTVTASGGTVDAGTSSLSGTFASSKTVTTSSTGTIVVAARVTTSSSRNTPTNCTVSIMGVSDIFTVTTRNVDSIPDPFSFPDKTGASPSTEYSSSTITVRGLEPNYSVTVTASGGAGVDAGTSTLSGFFSISKTVTTSSTGTLQVAVRAKSSTSLGTSVTTTVTVGGGSGTFTIRNASATPGSIVYSVPGTYTFQCPTYNVLNVELLGAGGGGGGGGTVYAGIVWYGYDGAAGGDSYFGSSTPITAGGGKGGKGAFASIAGGQAGTGSGGDNQGATGAPGGLGGPGNISGGAPGYPGGRGNRQTKTWYYGTTPGYPVWGTTYTVKVGAGGAGGITDNTLVRTPGFRGVDGAVYISWG